MSKGPSRQKHSASSSASRRYDQSLERVFNNHNTHSFSEHASNSEKANDQHRSQRDRRYRHHYHEHDSSARRHESSSSESPPEDHYHSTATQKHLEVDSAHSAYLYKCPRELSRFSDSAGKPAHVNRIPDRHSASVRSPRTNPASPLFSHKNRSPITSISTFLSDNRNSTKMAGDSPHQLLRVRSDNRKRSYQDSSSTVEATSVASVSNKRMHSSAASNCHASSTLDHKTSSSKGNTSTKAAKTHVSLSKLYNELSAVTTAVATTSPTKCPTDNQLRQIPVPTTFPFVYNNPLLFTQGFSKFQQPLSASPPSPSSSFDGSFFGESKVPRSGKPSDSPGQRVGPPDLPTSSLPGANARLLSSKVGGCSQSDGHHRSSGSASNWHHQADDSGAYVPGVDLLPTAEFPPSPNRLPFDSVKPADRRAGGSTASQVEEGEDDHHFAMDLASSPPTRSPQSSPLLPHLFTPLTPGQQQQQQQQQLERQQQQIRQQQSGNVSVGVLVSSQTSPYPIAAGKISKADNGGVPTSQEPRPEGHALSPAATSSMSGPSAGIELSKAAKSHNQRLKQQRSRVLPVKRITLPPLHLHLSEDGSSPLPPGWQRAPNTSRRDASGAAAAADNQSATGTTDGCNYAYYYYHTRTRQTRWDPPVYPWDADPEDKLERRIDDPEAPYNWGCAHRFAVTHEEIEAMYTQLRGRILERQCMELLHEQAGRPEAPQGAQEQNFAIELYTLVHNELRQFRDARAKLGRITSDEDLYFLTKKLAQSVIMKEMQKLHQTQAANSSSLFATSVAEVTPTIRQRATSYVRKYMEAKGPCYRRRAAPLPPPPPPQLPPPSTLPGQHHHQQQQNPRSWQSHSLSTGGGDDVPQPNMPAVPSGAVRLAPVLPPMPQHHIANAR